MYALVFNKTFTFLGPTQLADGSQAKEEEDSECSAAPCLIESSSIICPTWVACETCGLWYHLFCIGMRKVPQTFICKSCV